MNDDNLVGGVLGKFGQTFGQAAKKVGQQVVKIPEEMAKDVAGQVVGSAKKNTDKSKASENKPQWTSDEERVKFLRGLYGKSDISQDQASNPNQNVKPLDKKPGEFEKRILDKSPDDQKKLLELRQQLHKQVYYDPTFNPVKKQEERPAEKVEKEKKNEMQELQQKEAKKPQPLAIVRERNKAEMFRGVSG